MRGIRVFHKTRPSTLSIASPEMGDAVAGVAVDFFRVDWAWRGVWCTLTMEESYVVSRPDSASDWCKPLGEADLLDQNLA